MSAITPLSQEIRDDDGTTFHVSGSVGLTSILIPASAQGQITEVLIRCSINQPNTRRLSVAFDGGTNYIVLMPGESITWIPKNDSSSVPIQQIRILGNAANTLYEAVFNVDLV